MQVFNRTAAARRLEVAVQSPQGASLTLLGPVSRVDPYALQEGRVLVSVPAGALSGPVTPLRFVVQADGAPIQTIESSLVGPGKESR
jgi:hypothetical protein